MLSKEGVAQGDPLSVLCRLLLYLQRVVPNCEPCLLCNPVQCIERHILARFIPGTVSDSEKQLFSLPACHSGLGFRDPISTAVSSFKMYSSNS